MQDDKELTYMASIYMALADKTRLRLLNMMRDGEICVGSLTDTLGESQPKISRHLAYLRKAGIVDARRDGKWIHYRIHWPDEPGSRTLISAALEWVSGGDIGPQSSITDDHTASADNLTYAESPINDQNISDDEYEAHNELDDFLL